MDHGLRAISAERHAEPPSQTAILRARHPRLAAKHPFEGRDGPAADWRHIGKAHIRLRKPVVDIAAIGPRDQRAVAAEANGGDPFWRRHREAGAPLLPVGIGPPARNIPVREQGRNELLAFLLEVRHVSNGALLRIDLNQSALAQLDGDVGHRLLPVLRGKADLHQRNAAVAGASGHEVAEQALRRCGDRRCTDPWNRQFACGLSVVVAVKRQAPVRFHRVDELPVFVGAEDGQSGPDFGQRRAGETHVLGQRQRRWPEQRRGLRGDEDEDAEHGDDDTDAAEGNHADRCAIDALEPADAPGGASHSLAYARHRGVHHETSMGR